MLKKVKIENSLEINDAHFDHDNIFIIKRNSTPVLTVGMDSVLSIGELSSEPDVVDGGIIYLGGDFYLGI